LGDIPILGRLFTSKGNSGSKVNVVIYITPYIIKKSSDLSALRRNLDELESVQQQYNKIVFDRLENKSVDIPSKSHVTFAGHSQSRSMNRKDVTLPQKRLDSIVNAPQPVGQVVQPSTRYNSEAVPVVEEYSPVTDTNEYIQSESIMESLSRPNSVNLDNINTGIEYNEGTTFSDVSY